MALLVVLVGAFLSGWAAFAAGTELPSRLTTVGHGLLGLGVVALTPVEDRGGPAGTGPAGGQPGAGGGDRRLPGRRLRRGLRRLRAVRRAQPDPGPRRRGLRRGAAAGLAPAAAPSRPGAPAHRPGPPAAAADRRVRGRDRGGVRGAGGSRPAGGLPAGRRIASGSHRIAPAAVPATIWLLDRVPAVPADHRVRVDGTEVPVADLAAAAVPVRARLDCTSGWFADAEWSGVQFADLARRPTGWPAAASILVTSVTGYRRRFPVADAGRALAGHRLRGPPAHPRHRRAGPSGRPRPPRLLVGEVGRLRRAQRRPGVRPVALPAAVADGRLTRTGASPRGPGSSIPAKSAVLRVTNVRSFVAATAAI